MNRIIYKKIANKLNLPINEVQEVYTYYWKVYKDTLKEMPLRTDITKEEFKQFKTSFNIHLLGKLYVPYERCKNLLKVREYKNEHKRIKED